MPKNIQDIKTLAYVLRRTNYGEADRILNIITPQGKIAVIGKGVRKEKSKLAGGIEMFSLVELNIHQGKSDFGIITSARMLKYYDKLLKDFKKLELAANMLKKVSRAADSSDSSEYFKLVDQGLAGLNRGIDDDLVESWFLINLKRIMGEEINVYRDVAGQKLMADKRYDWNGMELAFTISENGQFGADEIKLLRLILTTDLDVVARVKDYKSVMMGVSAIAKMIN